MIFKRHLVLAETTLFLTDSMICSFPELLHTLKCMGLFEPAMGQQIMIEQIQTRIFTAVSSYYALDMQKGMSVLAYENRSCLIRAIHCLPVTLSLSEVSLPEANRLVQHWDGWVLLRNAKIIWISILTGLFPLKTCIHFLEDTIPFNVLHNQDSK